MARTPVRVSNVTALAPTAGIKDAATRNAIEALTNALNERSGYTNRDNPDRFITAGEIGRVTADVLNSALSGDIFGAAPGVDGVPGVKEVNDAIDNLADSIRKTILYQLLGEQLGPIDLNGIKRRIQQAQAGIDETRTIQLQKDMALASAILNIWASIGGTTSVIEDGTLAAATPTTAQATKWNQVVASVTDPNTGQINAASIKQELNAYANAANGTFNALYSVRAQISTGGQTVVGGFGLSATTGAGSSQGPTINFGVRADTFYIAATSGTPDGTTQENQGSAIPFMVLTSPQFVNGTLYPAGVFMKRAVIGDATIGTAKIADAAITNAKIGGDIASTNFVNGVSGWYLSRSGYFECSNIYARGNIRATSIEANVITAENIISNSLTQFYTFTSGFAVYNSGSISPQAIKVTCWPGYTTEDGKSGGTSTPIAVSVYLDGVLQGNILGAGDLFLYGAAAGAHTVDVRTSPGVYYLGRTNVEVIMR